MLHTEPTAIVRSPRRVLAVIDGYRLTGPARQLFAAAASNGCSTAHISLAIFQRSATTTPLVAAARCSQIPTFVVRDRFPGDPRTAIALARLTARPETDLLQTHGYKANVLGRLVAGTHRRPWIAFLHGETWENWKVRLYFALERLAVCGADRIVVVSRDMAARVTDRGVPSSKIRVLHNACLLEPSIEAEVPAWRGNARPVVAVVGRLSPEKGVDLALRVQRTVVQQHEGAQLWVIGEGPEEATLRNMAERLGIASSVAWFGYQENISALYRQTAVLLIPSRSEGLPNVALEGMAHGLPVVAAAVGGIPETISNGRTGFLAPAGDVEGLASRVVQLLDDPSLRRRLGQQGHEEARSRFSPQARLLSLSRVYEELLG